MTFPRRVLSVCALSGGLVALGCGSGDGDGASKPGSGYSTAGLRDAAKQIYDARDNGEDLRPYVSTVLTAYGVSISEAPDGPTLAAELDEGTPLVLPPQIDDLSVALDDGVLVGLDSFVAEMNLLGSTVEATGAPLSADFLGELSSALLAKSELGPDETLLAFVAALGQERAAREGTGVDPVWGDRALDPLQFMLLLDAVLYSGAAHPASGPASQPSPANTIQSAGAVGSKVGGYLTGKAGEQLGIPLTAKSAAQTSLCASLVLYGYKTTVTVVPNPIWHHQLDGSVAWTTQMTATMSFQDDYWNNYYGPKKDLIDVAGCTLPKQGPVEDGLSLEWDASAPLPQHGGFDIAASTTQDGKAIATFRAIEETTPLAKRTFDNQRDAVGRVKIQATGALPGWNALEWFVTNLKETGTGGTANLTILYYVDPCLPQAQYGGQSALVACAPTWTGTSTVTQFSGATITGAISFQNGVTTSGTTVYSASGTITYTQPGCTFSPATYTLKPEDGELDLDHATTPPTYYGAGYAQWQATVNCGSGPGGSAPIGGIWFTVPADPTNPFQVSPDGLKMEGTATDFSGSTATWSLTQGS